MPNFGAVAMLRSLCDLYQNDEILGNLNLEKFSLNTALQRNALNPDSEYDVYSDRYTRKFSDYTIVDHQFLRANDTTPTLNFVYLKELMLSKDHSRIEEYRNMVKSEKFLDKKNDMIGNRVAFASYPRTGNSFLRKILE